MIQVFIFYFLLEQHLDDLCVSTLVGESILGKKICHHCTFSINHKSTIADLVELQMVDFDVILGMDWLPACYASDYCRTRVVKFFFKISQY